MITWPRARWPATPSGAAAGPARARASRGGGLVAAAVELGAVVSLAHLVVGGTGGAVLTAVEDGLGYLGLPAGPSLFLVLLLGVLAAALRAGKQAALWVVFTFQLLAIVSALLAVDDMVSDPEAYPGEGPRAQLAGLAVTVVASALLLTVRGRFPARLAPGAWARALVTAGAGMVAVVVAGYGLASVFPGTLGGGADTLVWVVNQLLGELVAVPDPGITTRGPDWLGIGLDLAGTAVVALALFVFFRGLPHRRPLCADDELALRALLARHGEDDSLGYFATRRDKSVIFAPGGGAAITYRVLGGTSMASADPVGDPQRWPAAIAAWLDEAARYGWQPAVLGASERGARAYRDAGLGAWEIGDEAIIDVRGFSLDGRARRGTRQAVRRVRRAGYRCVIRRHGDVGDPEMREVAQAARRWRGAKVERGFSMALGRLGDPADARCVLVQCRDGDGRVRGLLSLVPWGRHGLSLDLMRRDPDAPNGLTEFLVTELVAACPGLGVRRVSLNFAMFRAVFENGSRIGAGPLLRAWRAALGVASRFFQLESLYRSNARYAPRWEPRFICYRRARRLPWTGLVAAAVEGFLPGPGGRPHASASFGRLFADRARQVEDVTPQPAAPPRADQVRVRMAKLAGMREAGLDPYPAWSSPPARLADVRRRFAGLSPDVRTGQRVSVTGRVRAHRVFGSLCFAVLADPDTGLQLMVERATLGADRLADWKRLVDLGDHVWATGEVVTSRTGELSVLVDEWTHTAKCLRPGSPAAVSPEAAGLVRARGAVLGAVRRTLTDLGYLEVETPMLHAVHGGANARPFQTHRGSDRRPLYLRIAPELYLKRLCVAGLDKVFELGRNFRNEGADATHNPEFTMLEAYRAYADYAAMRLLTEELVRAAAVAAHGRAVARRPERFGGGEHDLSGPWPVVGVYDAVSEALGVRVDPGIPLATLRQACQRAGVAAGVDSGHGRLVLAAYDQLVEPRTVAPTFYVDFPESVAPLARGHRRDPRLAERWDLVAFGVEIATAHTELTDPVEQRRRLEIQSLHASGGDPEAMELDEDFLAALEHGMPPTAGLGIGIDRLVAMLTGVSVRQTLLFPFVRAVPSGGRGGVAVSGGRPPRPVGRRAAPSPV
ncbi:bifunctional lysylphosphatidylglycerol synthetase/lysine--tRNA ligase LysX [Pseudonocardia acaciae]|uniref:bifunctional lysylphosphatidylglycerol synthetase/lysine--tRNA ligase LysX n=1 Tax=Pseudonocardia acaciae TaxID=551276 RepID=UPI000A003EF4|nr:bifunctional lysylphosphatidylglycerol synthetase/lysine--tRNA ligase LysX [Pseudonocardia acaciae]